MASVPGSKLAFFEAGQPGSIVNLGLTTSGSNLPTPVAGDFNIDVLPQPQVRWRPGIRPPSSSRAPQQLPATTTRFLPGRAPRPSRLLDGSYVVIDRTGGEAIQIVGAAAGGSAITVIGSNGDTITGSSIAANSQIIEANPNADAVVGPMTLIGGAGSTGMLLGLSDSVLGGAGATLVDGHPGIGAADTIRGGTGNMTVYGAGGDSIVGGAGTLLVNENQGHSGQENIAGGAGSLTAFDLGKSDTIGGSTGGTTYIDDSYGSGGGSLITGGSGTTGLLADGENTFIKTAAGDTVTGGTDLTLINATGGGATVTGGSGTVTGSIAGFQAGGTLIAINTAIEGGKGDNITGGAGATGIDGTPGSMTIAGGSGATTVVAGGGGDKITGGTGLLTVEDPSHGGSLSVTGGVGSLDVFNVGKGNTISGSTAGWSVINNSYDTLAGAGSSITGGSGTSSVPAAFGGIAANSFITGGAGDTITGSTGSMFVNAGTGNSITGASGANGATTINGANLDTIAGNTGALLVNITATNTNSTLPGSGNETINLGATHGAATLRDVDVSQWWYYSDRRNQPDQRNRVRHRQRHDRVGDLVSGYPHRVSNGERFPHNAPLCSTDRR